LVTVRLELWVWVLQGGHHFLDVVTDGGWVGALAIEIDSLIPFTGDVFESVVTTEDGAL
jgi:hypothetical protein